jgi:uncharacterized protein YbcI
MNIQGRRPGRQEERMTTGTEARPPLAGGALLEAISTSIVSILRDRYGRGPMNAKTYVRDDIIVVVLRGTGFTPLEQTMMDSGEPDRVARVVDLRHEFQGWMTDRYTETIEELTGRKVLAFLSQAHIEPDITMETFFIDAPPDGFEAPELKALPRLVRSGSRARPGDGRSPQP